MDPLLLLLAPVGMDVVSKLLGSVYLSAEGLVAEIQPRDGGRHRWVAVYKVAAELQGLKESMLQIRGVLLHSDLQRAPGSRALALQARDAASGMEDLVAMVEYRRLQSEVHPPAKLGTNLLVHAYMLCKRLVSCHGGPSRKPDEFLNALRAAAEQAATLVHMLDNGAGTVPFHRPLIHSPDYGSEDVGGQTGTVLQEHRVFGRDKEIDDILRMLMEPCAQPQLKVITISGLGGVGKTTLAQLAYNNASIEQHFDVRSWVFASTGFDRLQLAAEILRSAQPPWVGSAEKTLDAEVLQSELRQFLAHKTCLIVLDGLWDDAAWQDILAPLQSAGRRSRILVTTRKNIVPHMLSASQVYPINPLGIDDCWALIKEHAFRSDRADQYPDLQLFGREIAAKIHGLPLAAKMVGKLLEATRSKEQWKNVMGTLLEDSFLPVLHLSYNHLPGYLKRCFAYCSLFPNNWKLDPAHLSCLWVAEGFVQTQCRAEERMEDKAREYFDQLLSRSLFQELKLGSKIYYLMHDLLHDLAESVAADDCFRVEQVANWDIPLTVRHLSVTMNNLQGLVSFCNLKMLRTLLVLRSFPFPTNWIEMDFLEMSRDLRVLDLSGCSLTELPQSVGNLIHLRYLSVHGTIQRLPDSIGKLLHLQYLCFLESCSLEKLPAAISNLVNLRHLGVATKYTAGLVGIRRLINLQGSLEFHVEKLEGRTLEELRNINGLHGSLKVKGLENVSSYAEACRAELNQKRYLNSLSLEWGSTYRKLHPPSDAEVLEGLLAHPDLRELRIRRYCGTKAPSWLQSSPLQQLRSLHLINCRGLSALPALGHLPSLRTLHMRELSSVVQIGHEFYGSNNVAFPSLSILEFDDFPRLREWVGIEENISFPCLKQLMLIDCPKLTQIPLLPITTSEITIERTQLMPYMRLTPSSSSSERLQLDVCTSSVLFKGLLHEGHIKSVVALNISGAEELVTAQELGSFVSLQSLQLSRCAFTDKTLKRFLQALTCLSSLEIIDLPNITSLPVMEKHKLCPMVEELHIRNCQLLQSLSSLQFFESLRYLVIERCSNITATSFPENFRNLSSLEVLRISYCSGLQSFPACGLPSSLKTLDLIGCHPDLSKTIKKQERRSEEACHST